jgi:MFS family permease
VGAIPLALALACILFALSQAASATPWPVTAGIAASGLIITAVWIAVELRTTNPLVDLRLLRVPAVLAADLAVMLGGVGVYLLLSLAIRLVQAPTDTGYGFGATVIVAGLMLTPFSATSFLASRTIPKIRQRISEGLLLPVSCALVMLCLIGFAFLRTELWEVFAIMAVAGYGVGAIYATAPAFIVAAVPPQVTTSAVSFNLVLRTIGFAIGSALAGLLLQAATPAGATEPTNSGYKLAALIGAAALAAAVTVTAALKPRKNKPAVADFTDTGPIPTID